MDTTERAKQPAITVTVKEAAKILGLGRDNTFALVRSGRLRSVRAGRRILIPRFEIEAFLRRETEAEPQ